VWILTTRMELRRWPTKALFHPRVAAAGHVSRVLASFQNRQRNNHVHWTYLHDDDNTYPLCRSLILESVSPLVLTSTEKVGGMRSSTTQTEEPPPLSRWSTSGSEADLRRWRGNGVSRIKLRLMQKSLPGMSNAARA
jgi:hypothetical protein